MNKFASFVTVVLFAACGGKSTPKPAANPPQETAAVDHQPDGHSQEHGSAHEAAVGSADQHAGQNHAAAGSAEAKPAETKPAEPDPAKLKADLVAAEQAAFEQALPVFEKHCARCHKQGGVKATQKKRGHFDMTTYPFAGHHASTITAEIRKSLGLTGEKPTMPYDKKGTVKGDELAVIAAWADAFDKSQAGGAHETKPPEHGDKGHKH